MGDRRERVAVNYLEEQWRLREEIRFKKGNTE